MTQILILSFNGIEKKFQLAFLWFKTLDTTDVVCCDAKQ